MRDQVQPTGNDAAVTDVSAERFRAAFRDLAAGVVVVTCWIDGRPWGMTINSCCSISVRPARVLVSLQRSTRTYAAIEENGRLGVNILAAHQKPVAESAAAVGQPKFLDNYCARREDDTAPAVEGAMWFLDCRREDSFDVGDHSLIVGGVIKAETFDQSEDEIGPLLYFNRTYRLIGQQL